MKKRLLKYCTNWLMPSTRPRVTYNELGVCNACQWAEEKRPKLIGSHAKI
jgi:hypothetical protein